MNNKSQFLGTKKAIIKWLDKYGVSNYTINDDLSVDVNGDVDISLSNLKTIPVKFGNVTGNFDCCENKLTSLIGSPETVGGHFYCDGNILTSLVGSPKSVDNYFSCEDNLLKNLVGAPEYVGFNFWCGNNPLISLLELNHCKFETNIYFSVDKKNFKPKEIIKILEKSYGFSTELEMYELTYNEFQDIIKPQIQKQKLQKKLNKSKLNNKTISKLKNIFL